MKLILASRLALAAAALCATAASSGAQSLTYGPGTAMYRTTTRTVEEVSGREKASEVTMSFLISVKVDPRAGDTLAVTVTLEPAGAQPGAVPAPGIDALSGISSIAMMSSAGQIFSNTISDDSGHPAAVALAGVLARFLPHVRGELRDGATWTDTIASSESLGGIAVDRRSIVVSRVVGQETFNGVRAWKIDRATTATFGGSGKLGAESAKVEGTAKASAAVYVTRDAYIGAEETHQTTTKVTIPELGMEMSVTQSASQKTERVR
jgi:hypothetical protein